MGILNTFKKKNKDTDKEDKVNDKVRESGRGQNLKKDTVEKTEKKAEKEVKEKKKDTPVVSKKEKSSKGKKVKGSAYRVLVKPLITEKVTDMGMYNKYAFEVTLDTNKQEVKKAMQEVYGVVPISVNILNMKGKSVRFGRVTGKTKKWKKAIITLKKDDKIEVYQGV
jgi:large subunit ribosomal protein L23